jgi:hypothetical protein
MIYIMIYVIVYTMIYMHVSAALLIYTVISGQGRMTYKGTRGSAIGQRYNLKGIHLLDIHLSKAERHEAVLLPGHRLLTVAFSDEAGATADSSVGISNGSRLYELNH